MDQTQLIIADLTERKEIFLQFSAASFGPFIFLLTLLQSSARLQVPPSRTKLLWIILIFVASAACGVYFFMGSLDISRVISTVLELRYEGGSMGEIAQYAFVHERDLGRYFLFFESNRLFDTFLYLLAATYAATLTVLLITLLGRLVAPPYHPEEG